MPMPKCLSCGKEIVKPEDFASGDISKNLCAQCSTMRVSQHRPKPWQDTAHHKQYGNHTPPTEAEVHQVFIRRLKEMGKSPEEIKRMLQKWHNEHAA